MKNIKTFNEKLKTDLEIWGLEIGDKVKVGDEDPWEEIRGKEGVVIDIGGEYNRIFIDFGEEIESVPSKNCFQTNDLGGRINTPTGLSFGKNPTALDKFLMIEDPRLRIKNLTKI